MRIRLSVILITVVCLSAISKADDMRPVQTQNASAGVFSQPQTVRGRLHYLQNCSAGCHMPNLTGSERAPALASEMILRQWEGKSLYDVYFRIKSSMPQQRPGSLPAQLYIDILAYLLQANGLPFGNSELSTDEVQLRHIVVDAGSTLTP
jgi:S-disulfanyl-L-cysteine oxidoreductase SoxD